MTKLRLMVITLALFAAACVGYGATNYYVWKDNPTPLNPYTNWAMAATNIQSAVGLTMAGDIVYVTNGVYDTGGTVAPGTNTLTNRVCVTTAITLRSMNGPEFTTIKGMPDGVTGSNGNAAVRCVYLTNSASLIGFTLTDGYTMTNGADVDNKGAGGILLFANTVVSNCLISENAASGSGAGAILYRGGTMNNSTLSCNRASAVGGALLYYGGTMNNCTLSGNMAAPSVAGGAYIDHNGTMNNCILSGNTSASYAGGVYFLGQGGTMNYCTISNNFAVGGGGGVYFNQGGTMNNCSLLGNSSADSGGGAVLYLRYATMNNCKLTGNMSTNYGGGVFITRPSLSPDQQCSLNNCLLSGNIARSITYGRGGGAYLDRGGALSNCTFYGNTAVYAGGGISFESSTNGTGVVNNCIIWGNNHTSSSNVYFAAGSTAMISYSCSVPIQSGAANVGADPLFVDINGGNYRLTVNSPCVNAGANADWMTNSVDLDGRQRIRYGVVDMGAYEAIYDGTIYRMGF